MNQIMQKAIADITASGDEYGPHGGFEAVLSAPTLDRDGDVFDTASWKTPLPDRIVIDVDHEMSVAGTVGSAEPFFDDNGNLCVRGTFASTPRAQEVRTLIQEGHISTMSVACMTDKSLKKAGEPCRELLNGAFVAIPSNRESVITSVKAAEAKAGARNSKSDQSWIQAAHDATVMAGAGCVEADPDDEDGESDGANKDITLNVTTEMLQKAVEPMVIGAKSVKGSLEDLQSTIGDALDAAYTNSGASFSYLVATFLSGDGGTIVYRLYPANDGPAQTLSRAFTLADDGSVTLATEVEAVELVTTTTIAEKSAAESKQPILTPEQFEQLLAEVTKASSPSGAGEPQHEAKSPVDAPAEPPAPEGAAGDAAAKAADGAESDVAGELPERLLSMAQTAMSRLE